VDGFVKSRAGLNINFYLNLIHFRERFRDSGFRGSGFRGSEVQGSEVQRFRGSGFRGSGLRIQRFKGSAPPLA
jgi:hypothetical protein